MEELTTGYISGGEIAAELEEKFAGMVVPRDKMMTLLEAGDNEQALNIYFDEYDSIATQVRENAFAAGGCRLGRCTEQSE